MKLRLTAAICAALSLGACANPVALVEGVRVLNDGCDREIKATFTFASPMPPSGTVEVFKRCAADKRAGASAIASAVVEGEP